jgi:uncharacterized membrane protein HdeD (DUF308 family)
MQGGLVQGGEKHMRIVLATNWWALVLRGLVGILMGVLTFVWPGVTLAALVIVFGAYALVDGIFVLVAAVRAAKSHERWGALMVSGLAGIGAGVLTMLWPAITALALVYLIAAWAIVTGVLEIMAAVRLRRVIQGEWLLALSGIASLVFGVLMIIAPLPGALVIALWVGAYAFVSGVVLVTLGFKLRSWGRRHIAGGTAVPLPAH